MRHLFNVDVYCSWSQWVSNETYYVTYRTFILIGITYTLWHARRPTIFRVNLDCRCRCSVFPLITRRVSTIFLWAWCPFRWTEIVNPTEGLMANLSPLSLCQQHKLREFCIKWYNMVTDLTSPAISVSINEIECDPHHGALNTAEYFNFNRTWRRSVVVSALASINAVNRHWARLLLDRWLLTGR